MHRCKFDSNLHKSITARCAHNLWRAARICLGVATETMAMQSVPKVQNARVGGRREATLHAQDRLEESGDIKSACERYLKWWAVDRALLRDDPGQQEHRR